MKWPSNNSPNHEKLGNKKKLRNTNEIAQQKHDKAKKQLIKEINDEMRKVNGKPNDDLINLNRKEMAELNKVIKRINK